MTLPDTVSFGLFLLGAGSCLLVGALAGLAIGHVGRVRLKAALQVRTAELQARASAEAEREAALALASERLSATFGELASQQFRSHADTFLKLARESMGVHHERAKGDLAAREQAIENLVRPIREALQRTDVQLQELEKSRRESQAVLQAQLEAITASQRELSVETRNLVSALRRPEVRGQWGEITLRRLVELAGMVEHCDFVSQSHRATADGAIRPDMVIHLPEGRQLVVDVKTPLDAYLDAIQSEDEAAKRAAFARHAATLAERVRELSAKAYWTQFEKSPEFVILFIPGDQFLSAALSQRPALLDEALRQNIILATPTSLVALLKAVAYGWQQVTLTENAAEIRRIGTQLYERLNSFAGHLLQVGKSLGDSVKAYNRGIGSLERLVLPGARRFTELGVTPRQELPTLSPIEESPREGAAVVEASNAECADAADMGRDSDDAEVADRLAVSTARE
ncbi:MAG TPA: DNA recombination protein RmuC [Gammaproteobacteria bacterium]